jgi:hypothetical protein
MQPLLNSGGSGGDSNGPRTCFSTLKMQTTNFSETMVNVNLYGVPTENKSNHFCISTRILNV